MGREDIAVRSPSVAAALSPTDARAAVAYRVALAFAGSWIVAALAQFEVMLPFTPVPITGQTLGVLLVGGALGSRLGAAALLLYLGQGAFGMPMFSGGDGGTSFLTPSSATGGYLWGFVVAAAVVGRLSEARLDRSIRTSVIAMGAGGAVIYLVGVPWLMLAIDVPFREALTLGFTPFLVGDVLKALVAGAALPLAWRITRRDDRSV